MVVVCFSQETLTCRQTGTGANVQHNDVVAWLRAVTLLNTLAKAPTGPEDSGFFSVDSIDFGLTLTNDVCE